MFSTKVSIRLRNGRIKQNIPFVEIFFFKLQSNINTDTKGTEPIVRFTLRCPYYRGVRKERLDCTY